MTAKKNRPTTKAAPATSGNAASTEEILAELERLSPLPTKQATALQKKYSPESWNRTRKEMLIELLQDEGPGDNLAENLRKWPSRFFPESLESYRRTRDLGDELIAQRTKADFEESVNHLKAKLAYESDTNVNTGSHYDHYENRLYVIRNLKAALESAKALLDEFDECPIRRHAIARHLKYRKHSHVTAEECIACNPDQPEQQNTEERAQ